MKRSNSCLSRTRRTGSAYGARVGLIGLLCWAVPAAAPAQDESPFGRMSGVLVLSDQARSELGRFTPAEQQTITGTITSAIGTDATFAYSESFPSNGKSDLVVVLDLLFTRRQSNQSVRSPLGDIQGDELEVGAGLTIWTGRRSRIDSVRVSAVTPPFSPWGSADERWPLYQAAVEQAAGRLQAGLRASEKLTRFASKGRKPAEKVVRDAEPAPEPVKEEVKVAGPAVDKPAYKFPENPDNFAVVIGIEKYAGLPDALYAERDAKAVRAHLEALGYPARNIAMITGAQASRAGIAKNIETWLSRNVKERSTVFVYYSGHGAPDPVKGEAYLIPADGDPQYLEDTAYPVKRLYEKLEALKASRVIVTLDACFSGAGGRSVLAKGTRPLVSRVDLVGGPLLKTIAFSASAADQISGVAEGQGHGLFTYFLLRGLNETQGAAKAKDLFAYFAPRVQDEAKRVNRDQTPQMLPSEAGPRERWSMR